MATASRVLIVEDESEMQMKPVFGIVVKGMRIGPLQGERDERQAGVAWP